MTGTDLRITESQQAVQNGPVQERMVMMEGERRKVKRVSLFLQVKPTIPASRTGHHPISGAFSLQHLLESEQDKNLLLIHLPVLHPSPPVAAENPHRTI